MRRTVFALLALLAGSACAVAQPAAPKKGAGLKTVGVISAIGGKFAVQKVGITAFGNELKEASIDSWGIDDLVAAKVNQLLSKRFVVRKIAYPKGAFASFENPAGLFRDREAELREIVRKIAASQKCDVYVVVTKGGSPFSSTNQFLTGVGIVEAGGALYSDNIYLFALSVVGVYDGQTFELVKRQSASIGQTTFMAIIKGPHRKLDQSWWPASPQAVQNEKLKSATRALVEQSLAMTVPDLLGAK